jgi:hypothetical protein
LHRRLTARFHTANLFYITLTVMVAAVRLILDDLKHVAMYLHDLQVGKKSDDFQVKIN